MARQIRENRGAWRPWGGFLLLAVVLVLLFILIKVFIPRDREVSETTSPLREPSSEPLSAPEVVPAFEAPKEKNVFVSRLAGRWYSDNKASVVAQIDEFLSKVEGSAVGEVHALILPHAGYAYSGQTAAYGLKTVVGRKFDRVVVMGPSHSVAMENMASVPNATHYATLLGEVPLDLEFIDALKRHDLFQTIPRAHEGEHSVQIEVPLLQHIFEGFSLVPIVVGQLDVETSRKMAEIVLGLIDAQTLVVASSDFTHYGRRFSYFPFRDDVPNNIKKLDMGAVETIEDKNLDAFAAYLDDTGATICGRNAIKILLAMLPQDSEAQFLHYDTSGRQTGDYASSVSYISIAFKGRWRAGQPVAPKNSQVSLSEDDQKQLLVLARKTLASYLELGRPLTPEELGIEITPAMKATRGAFVTLNKNGQLRGCIGEIFPRRALYKAVMAHAINAGLNDRRFPRVRATELAELEIEISMLTPPAPVASYDDIIIGTHGVVIEKNGRTAVFLPQVAPEQGWGLDETLRHLSKKAGLQEDAWKNGASFTVFEALVFAEGEG